MKIELARQNNNGLQFIVKAENDAEQIVLEKFLEQTRSEVFHLHGSTVHSGTLGVSSFNFGTKRKDT